MFVRLLTSFCLCFSLTLYRLQNIQYDFIRAEEEVAKSSEFRGLKEFAVVYQPLTTNFSVLTKKGKVDLSLLSYDCFHMSQKGHA